MAAIKPSHNREVEELVSQQIHAFKSVAPMDECDIFEYHLRYFRIMAIYREMDRIATLRMQEQSARWRSHIRESRSIIEKPAPRSSVCGSINEDVLTRPEVDQVGNFDNQKIEF